MSQNDETRKRMVAYIQSLAAARSVSDDNIPCKIEEGLFLGSLAAANNKEALKDLNVTHILTVAKWLNPIHPNDFVYKKIDVLDTSDTNLMVHFENCFDFIDEARRAGGGVLVHCFAGRSRSVTVIIAYLMKRNGMRLSTAYALVKSKRLQISPNTGFMLQLEEFEKNLRVLTDPRALFKQSYLFSPLQNGYSNVIQETKSEQVDGQELLGSVPVPNL